MGLTNLNLSTRINASNSSTSDGGPVVSNATIAAKTVVFFVTIAGTLFGNGLIYTAMVKFKTLRTPTNWVLSSLATTDLLMVVVMVLHAITELSGKWIFGRVLCHVFATLGLVLSFISILHLCFLSIDRFLAIKRPLKYRTLMTRKRVFVVLVFLWLGPAAVANLPWSNYHFRSEVYGCEIPQEKDDRKTLVSPFIFVLTTLFVVLPFGVMLFLHARVFQVALSHARSLSATERSIRRNNNGDSVNTKQKRILEIHSLRREIKSAKTFALVIGVFLICYIPFFTAGTYRKFAGPKVVPDVVMFITTWIAFANCFCNPLVYSLRYSPLKKAFKKLLYSEKARRCALNTSMASFHASVKDKTCCDPSRTNTSENTVL